MKQTISLDQLNNVSKRRDWVMVDRCPVCESERWKPVLVGRCDCLLSMCEACTTVFLNPRPGKTDNMSSGYARDHAKTKYLPRMVQQGFLTPDYKPDLARLYHRYQKLVDLTNSLEPAEPVVDIGCSIGLSILALSFKNIPAIGFDVDDSFIVIAKELFNLDVRKVNVFDSPAGQKYPIATANAVLEHIEQPVAFLTAIRENILQPGGTLVLTVPNILSLRFLELGPQWETISGGHVWYPSERTMKLAAERAGYTVERVYLPSPRAGYTNHYEFYVRELLGYDGNLTGGIGMILRARRRGFLSRL